MESLQITIAKQQKKYPLLCNYTVKKPCINSYETLIGPLYQNKQKSACVLVKKHMNGFGFTHGGFLSSFAEFSMYCIAVDHVKKVNAINQSYISLVINGRFLSSSKQGCLIEGDGVVIKETDKMLFIKGQLTSKGKIIYDFNGILRVLQSSTMHPQKLTSLSCMEKYPFLKNYKVLEPHDPFEHNIAPIYYHNQSHGACVVMDKNMNHCNRVSMGFLMTFADFSLFMIAYRETKEAGVTLTLNSRYITSPKVGDLLRCTGRVVKNTRRLIFVKGQMISNGKLILDFDGIVKKIPAHKPSNMNAAGKL